MIIMTLMTLGCFPNGGDPMVIDWTSGMEADADTDTDTDTGIEVEVDPFEGYIEADGDNVLFDDSGFVGIHKGSDAYVVGYSGDEGSDLDWTLQSQFLIENDGDNFVLDTSSWIHTCYEVTLVSSLQSDGSAATSIGNTGDWWDNFELCTNEETDIGPEWCHSEGDGNYLVAFCVTSSGVVPNGD